MLFCLADDPAQHVPVQDEAQERRMIALMKRLMAQNACPEEQYARLGLA